MPVKRYLVELSPEERQELTRLVSAGRRSARTITRARILLKADQAPDGPACDDGGIADALGCGKRTVERVRQRLVEEGLEAALTHKPQCRPSRQPVLDGAAEARLVALACSEPPDGRAGWTLRLLADRLVELEVVETVSTRPVQAIRSAAPATRSGLSGRRDSRGRRPPVCIPSARRPTQFTRQGPRLHVPPRQEAHVHGPGRGP